jgi:hypothetical protein
MAVLTALRRSPGALHRNPVLLVPVLTLMLAQLPTLLLQSVNPLFASVVSTALSLVFVAAVPFFQGGLFAMADEALGGAGTDGDRTSAGDGTGVDASATGGRTSLATFFDGGKRHYVSILVAYLVMMAVNFVLGMIAFSAAIAGGVLYVGSDGLGGHLAVLAVLGLLVAVGAIAYLLVMFFLQFYGQAIVLEDRGAVAGLRRSARVVREHLLSTLGYVILGAVVGAIAGVGFAAASIFLSPEASSIPMAGVTPPDPSFAIVAVVSVAVVALGTLFGGFFTVFSVSFYREIAG